MVREVRSDGTAVRLSPRWTDGAKQRYRTVVLTAEGVPLDKARAGKTSLPRGIGNRINTTNIGIGVREKERRSVSWARIVRISGDGGEEGRHLAKK